ncbi:MAG: pyruvate, phosphate dikinase [Planctomycetes bacterium]|nr:pyruvate, phosphate dikinase [Planctomycetota bacterium]
MAKTQSKSKYVYFFGNGRAEGRGDDRQRLGGKGAGLAEMTGIGLPVPAGFTITTDCCASYHNNEGQWPRGLESQVRDGIRKLERARKKKFGHPKDPLLVSVRSGAAQSMPGMMESILNLGLNDESVEGLGKVSGNLRFALDSYRRLIMMYGSTAKGIARDDFEDEFRRLKELYTRARLGRRPEEKVLDTDVNEQELYSLIHTYKRIYRDHAGEEFPQAPYEQLLGAISAVFDSWMLDKAVTYRRVEHIVGLNGTAVNVQQMVFGNMGEDSGTGVCFTRDPSTGENVFYGDFLINAQGEDVVAGVRTPLKLAALQEHMPDVHEQLEAVRVMLELHYQDMQDLEFTIERGKLYMLQCRRGQRSPGAAIRIAVEQATKPLIGRAEANRLLKKKYLPESYSRRATKPVITPEQAIQRVTAEDLERLFYPVIDPEFPRDELQDRHLASGINAAPGAACGRIVFSAAEAERQVDAGECVILVRKETNPEDVGGMYVAQGILTATGGKTSHAAVVARGWGKCCIVGCEALRIDYNGRGMMVGGVTLTEGDYLTLDGSEGHVYSGKIPLISSETPPEYNTLMGWCDRLRKLEVRANADTPEDARKAIELGAEGIGLCRTEHMFFDSEQRRLAMQEMIIADGESARREALDKLLPFQRDDFVGIFTAMDGRPVTVRLIDPPLHEFLPHTAADQEKLAQASGVPIETIQRRTEQLHETNPMLGHRGCRLSITYPEILEMQVTAIIEAAIICKRDGIDVYPEIMIPLTIDPKELDILVQRTRAVAGRIIEEAGEALDYVVGTMIETPRAALLGDRIAEVAEFFSFGTNDLTQTTLSLSRDDAGRFLPDYVDESKAAIFPHDPFHSIDIEGVGLLIKWCIERGRRTKPRLKIGICGEHGGEARSVHFCHEVGMDYVSCSPFRVPIARLAAAQAAIQGEYGQAVQIPVPRRLAAAKAKPVRRKTASKRKKVTQKATKKSKARKSGAKPGKKKKKAPARTKKTKPAKKTKLVKKTRPAKKSKSKRAKGKPKKKKTAKKRKR